MALKLVIADPKSGRCAQKELGADQSSKLMGMKIGDSVKGEVIGFSGYEFMVTGGSDYAGFPMRSDVPGTGRKRILAVSGVGLKPKGKGIKQRKTVCGNTIHQRIAQVNLKILKEGTEKIVEAGEPKKKEKAAAAGDSKKKEKANESVSEKKKEVAAEAVEAKKEKIAESAEAKKEKAVEVAEANKETAVA